jgi:hypothetical protein
MVSMRTIARLCAIWMVAFLTFCLKPATAQDDETMDWLDDYQKAREEAKRTHKPIFLEFRCEA